MLVQNRSNKSLAAAQYRIEYKIFLYGGRRIFLSLLVYFSSLIIFVKFPHRRSPLSMSESNSKDKMIMMAQSSLGCNSGKLYNDSVSGGVLSCDRVKMLSCNISMVWTQLPQTLRCDNCMCVTCHVTHMQCQREHCTLCRSKTRRRALL